MIHNTFKYSCAFVSIALSLLLVTCSLDRIDPSVKYDPCLGKVVAKFSHDQIGVSCDSPCNLSVKFTNNSTGAKSYTWEFGDGGTSTEATPTYIYKKSGRFDIKLTAKGENGCSNESIEVYTIGTLSTPNPIANFTFEYGGGNQFAPTTVNFNSSSSEHANAYCWFVNDSLFSTLNNPSFTFNQPGNYTIKLVAKAGSKESPPRIQVVEIKRITFDSIQTGFGPIKKVIVLPNGEYVAAGTNYLNNPTRTEAYIFKMTARGIIQPSFTKTFSLNNSGEAYDLIPLSGYNSFAICGSTLSSNGTNTDAFFAKVDANGTVQTPMTRFGNINRNDFVQSMVEVGQYVVFSGNADVQSSGNNDIWLSKRDPANPLLAPPFDRTYPVSPGQSEYGRDVVSMPNQGFMIFEFSAPTTGLAQSFLSKTDVLGNQIANFRKVVGKPTDYNEAQTITAVSGNRFLLTGTTYPNGTADSKGWMVLTDALGNALNGSTTSIGTVGIKSQIFDSIETATGDFACAGSNGVSAWFVRTTATATILTQNLFGSVGKNVFYAIRPTQDGGYILVGEKNGTAYMVKI